METAEDKVLFQKMTGCQALQYVISWTQSSDLPWEWNTVDSYIPADAAVQEREDVPVRSWVYVLKPEHPFFGNSCKLGKGCEACFGKGKAMEVDPGGLLWDVCKQLNVFTLCEFHLSYEVKDIELSNASFIALTVSGSLIFKYLSYGR